MRNPHLHLAAIFVAALAAAPIATATPLDTKGIPADAQGIVHIDFAAYAKSAIGAMLHQLDGYETSKAFKTQFGIDIFNDLDSATIGYGKYDLKIGGSPVFEVIRGNFSIEKKIMAAAKQANALVTTEGGYTFIENLHMEIADVVVPIAKGSSAKQVFCFIDARTLLVAYNKPDLLKLIAAYTGQAKSYVPPSALAKQTAVLIGYHSDFSEDIPNDAGEWETHKAKSIYFSITEDGQKLQARVDADFASPDEAKQIQGALTGYAQKRVANAGHQQSEESQTLKRILDGLKITINDATLEITLIAPISDLKKFIQSLRGG